MSPFAPNPDRDRVLQATDLVALIGEHIALRPKGREHVGLCPFHDDRTPSFQVVSHKGTPFYKCFACGASGNAFDFLINYHKMSFYEALKLLAARAGIELTQRVEREEPRGGPRKEDLYRANQLAMKLYRRLLNDPTDGVAAREAIAKRRIAPEMVEAFQLGYAPDRRDGIESAIARANAMTRETGREGPPSIEAFIEAGVVREGSYGRSDLLRHRITFPIFDDLGRPIAFGGRKIRDEDEPKYLNSPESPLFHKGRALYGIHLAKQHIIKSEVAIVTEGYTDVIACHEAGIKNVVATLGTALTREHARILQRLCSTVVLLFDGDAAGMRAADRGVEVFFAERIDVKVCTLPDDLDPDELLREPGGVEIFRKALDGAVDALTYFIRRFRAEYTSKPGMSGKQKVLEAMLAKLVDLGFGALSGIRRRMILGSLATATGLPEAELEAALPERSARAVRPAASDPRSTPPGTSAVDRGEPSDSIEADRDLDDGRLADDAPPAVLTRARREAEKFLLALLLAHPEFVHETFPVADPEQPGATHPLPLLEACPPSIFLDADHRAVYRTWHDVAEAGQIPTFSIVLAELADSRRKGLASDLWLLGDSLRERDDRTTLDRIREAFASLERVVARDGSRSPSGESRFASGSRQPFGEPRGPLAAERRPVGGGTDGWEVVSDNAAEPDMGLGIPAEPAKDLAADAASPARNAAALAADERLRQIRERGPDVTRIPRRIKT